MAWISKSFLSTMSKHNLQGFFATYYFWKCSFYRKFQQFKMFFFKNILKTKYQGIFFFKPKAISVNKISLFWKVCGKYHLMTNAFDKRHTQSNHWNAPADRDSAEINLMFGSEMNQKRTFCSSMQEIFSRKMPFGFKDVFPEGRSLVAGAGPRVWCLPGRKRSQFRTGFLHSSRYRWQ